MWITLFNCGICKTVEFSISEDDESSSGETSSSSTGLALEAILQRLPTCVNKEFIDEVLQLPCNSLLIPFTVHVLQICMMYS